MKFTMFNAKPPEMPVMVHTFINSSGFVEIQLGGITIAIIHEDGFIRRLAQHGEGRQKLLNLGVQLDSQGYIKLG